MSESLQQRIAGALARVRNSRLGRDVMSAEQVHDVATTTDGKVRLTLVLDPADDATLVRDVRQAVEGVSGVADVRVDVADPQQYEAARDGVRARQRAAATAAPPAPAPPPQAPKARTLPVMDTGARQAPSVPAAPTPVSYPKLGKILAVSSGKGGVGKSTVAVNLACALAKRGLRVGIMDADVYGPNLPLMLGVDEPPPVRDLKIQPLMAYGVKIMSIGFMIEKDQPAIWRGPIIMKVITQFLKDVDWGQLDYLIVDMPPGTGDAQLSLVQATHIHGGIIVTTPQQVAVGDALRGVKMFERVSVPVLGIVENMSYLENPETGKPIAVFGAGGGQKLADQTGVPLLGQVPLDPRIVEGGDTGRPIVVAEPKASVSRALEAVADRVLERIAERYG
ncbi:MAG TPA: Mrp/NBP35 family ATP-binding protein [Gemmatirosa sp.]|nr:Mrp/NBP35 family ATP-binding protein [Gemmatirosa sp.]